MGLPNIGPMELILVLGIALLILGPGRLPGLGKAIGETMREFRKASSDLREGTSLTAAEPAATQPEPNTLSGEAKPNTNASAAATPPEAPGPAADPVDQAKRA